MARKCGFFDCSNPATKRGYCQSCKKRKEQFICAACRQTKETAKNLEFRPSLVKQKYLYQMAATVQGKLPSQLQTEFDQLLPQLKLSTREQELITKSEKLISDFLVQKGGKKHHID
jgi:hypothetical protein